jgi:uncharacterized protein (DUF2267 family)
MRAENRKRGTVEYDDIVDRVQERTELESRVEAERSFLVVLQLLCDRVTGDQSWDLLAQLPAKAKKSVLITAVPARVTREELVARAAEHLAVPVDQARERVRAVFATLREAVTSGELDHVIRQLGGDWVDLLA